MILCNSPPPLKLSSRGALKLFRESLWPYVPKMQFMNEPFIARGPIFSSHRVLRRMITIQVVFGGGGRQREELSTYPLFAPIQSRNLLVQFYYTIT